MDEKPDVRICRTCLKQIDSTDGLLCIYQVSHLLMSCTSIKIMENDGLPSNICDSCHKKANQAYNFKIQCEQSEQKLRNNIDLFGEFIVDSVNIKEEKDDLGNDDDGSTIELENCTDKIQEKTTDGFFKFLVKQDNIQSKAVYEDSNSEAFHNIKCENVTNKVHNTKSLKEEKLNNKPYRCCFCGMNFTQKTRLLKHEKKHEDGIKCSICDKAFSTFQQLRNHVNIHNRKGAHLCQTCGKQFTMPENLTRHQRIHNGIRPYKCKLCNKSFTQSNELKSHMVTHSSEKTHLCNVCGNKYARYMSLQIHMRRLHSDASIIRPYHCEICGRAFKDKRDLAQHTLIHKDEKKHICKVCGKAFNRASNLKVHERIHSGPRPFVCSVCQRSFTQKHVLNTHLKTHPNS